MLRAEVHLSTEVRHSGATGAPRLILTLHAEGPPDGFDIEGQIVIKRLDAWRAEHVESELVRRLNGKALLCLGPPELGNILDGSNVSPALQRLARVYGWDAEDIARKAGIEQSSAARALAGSTIYTKTRIALGGFIERVLTRPTIGETIRRCRRDYGVSQAHVAKRCEVRPYDISQWENDEARVPPEKRRALRQAIGLPDGMWADERAVHLVQETPDEDPFPVQLRQAREEAQMSIQGLAEAVGVSVSAVSSWETGKHAPHPRHAQALARVLDLDGRAGGGYDTAA